MTATKQFTAQRSHSVEVAAGSRTENAEVCH